MRRIVCACIKNIHSGVIVLGARHHHCYQREGISEYPHKDWIPGFIDQDEVFMTREEAWVVAEAAGQILNTRIQTTKISELYSEHLY